MKFLLMIGLLAAVPGGCKQKGDSQEEIPFSANQCRVLPPFVTRLGFDKNKSAFSTSDNKKMGLLLIEVNDPNDTSANSRRVHQHPSWKSAGWLAPIQLDNRGNIFVGPAPLINVFNNPTDKQNQLQKVDGVTGEMKMFVDLPKGDAVNEQNAFGILGLTFFCEAGTLYASSVSGSSRSKEAGGIYCIDPETGDIKDQLDGVDAFGLGICNIEGKHKLYFGKARNGDIFSITLTAGGKFADKPQKIASIEGLGPRGDDKVKKIVFSPRGEMMVEGYEFNFNLIAPTEKQTTQYRFRYNPNSGQWDFMR
jgi:hypothetical protein